MKDRTGAKKMYKVNKTWIAAGLAAATLFSVSTLGSNTVSAATPAKDPQTEVKHAENNFALNKAKVNADVLASAAQKLAATAAEKQGYLDALTGAPVNHENMHNPSYAKGLNEGLNNKATDKAKAATVLKDIKAGYAAGKNDTPVKASDLTPAFAKGLKQGVADKVAKSKADRLAGPHKQQSEINAKAFTKQSAQSLRNAPGDAYTKASQASDNAGQAAEFNKSHTTVANTPNKSTQASDAAATAAKFNATHTTIANTPNKSTETSNRIASELSTIANTPNKSTQASDAAASAAFFNATHNTIANTPNMSTLASEAAAKAKFHAQVDNTPLAITKEQLNPAFYNQVSHYR